MARLEVSSEAFGTQRRLGESPDAASSSGEDFVGPVRLGRCINGRRRGRGRLRGRLISATAGQFASPRERLKPGQELWLLPRDGGDVDPTRGARNGNKHHTEGLRLGPPLEGTADDPRQQHRIESEALRAVIREQLWRGAAEIGVGSGYV